MIRHLSLHHMQMHLPWTLPYSEQFYSSQMEENHRYLAHDMAHVVKSLGKIASAVEDIDHGRASRISADEMADAIADLVICALHMAKTNPLKPFDLGTVVIDKLESRNGVKIPDEREIER